MLTFYLQILLKNILKSTLFQLTSTPATTHFGTRRVDTREVVLVFLDYVIDPDYFYLSLYVVHTEYIIACVLVQIL